MSFITSLKDLCLFTIVEIEPQNTDQFLSEANQLLEKVNNLRDTYLQEGSFCLQAILHPEKGSPALARYLGMRIRSGSNPSLLIQERYYAEPLSQQRLRDVAEYDIRVMLYRHHLIFSWV